MIFESDKLKEFISHMAVMISKIKNGNSPHIDEWKTQDHLNEMLKKISDMNLARYTDSEYISKVAKINRWIGWSQASLVEHGVSTRIEQAELSSRLLVVEDDKEYDMTLTNLFRSGIVKSEIVKHPMDEETLTFNVDLGKIVENLALKFNGRSHPYGDNEVETFEIRFEGKNRYMVESVKKVVISGYKVVDRQS